MVCECCRLVDDDDTDDDVLSLHNGQLLCERCYEEAIEEEIDRQIEAFNQSITSPDILVGFNALVYRGYD